MFLHRITSTFRRHWARLDFLVHEVLLLAVHQLLALQEVEMISGEEVKFVLHLPNFGFFYLSFCDGQWIGLSLRLAQVRLV